MEIRSLRDDEAVEAAVAVFAMLRFNGMGSVDLIRGTDGVRFLELNPRPWGSLGAARDAGVDCFAPLAALLRGESPSADLRFTNRYRLTRLSALPACLTLSLASAHGHASTRARPPLITG